MKPASTVALLGLGVSYALVYWTGFGAWLGTTSLPWFLLGLPLCFVLPWVVCEALWQGYRLVLAGVRAPWRRWRAALRTWGLCDDPRCIRRGWRRPILRPEDHRIGAWVCAGECERIVEELGE